MKRRGRAKWHLGESEVELAFAEFQHAVICYAESFYRFIGKSLSTIAGEPNLTGYDSVILNTIHVLDRPKGVTEIQHFTNRGDVANIQYSIRKLIRAGLAEKVPRAAGRGTTYRVTAKGRAVAREFVAARRALLSQIPVEGGKLTARLADARNVLTLMTGLYDQASRLITTRA
ncbi:MAG TPA: winged helix DNA-binding protein [Alphaproteobacteria bacterium]|jgi:predicted MarR family transcription regulator